MAVLCLFVFGLWPLSVLFCFVFPVSVGRYAYLTGGCALLPYACVWLFGFMPPVVFAQFQLRFERVSVPALYVLRSIFRTEPLSSIGRNVRKKIDHLFVHCPRATGHSADGESAFQLHAWGDQ